MVAVGGQRLPAILHTEQVAQGAIGLRPFIELRLDEDDRDAKLVLERVQVVLHPVLVLAGVDDELGARRRDGLLVQVALRPERRPEYGKVVGNAVVQVDELVFGELLREPRELLGGDGDEDLRGGVARGDDAVDVLGHLDLAAGGVGEQDGLGLRIRGASESAARRRRAAAAREREGERRRGAAGSRDVQKTSARDFPLHLLPCLS